MASAKNVRRNFWVIFVSVFVFVSLPINNVKGQDIPPNIEDYVFKSSWGGEGKQILRPADVAVSTNGKIYILNSGFDRITILDKEGSIYNEIGGFGEGDEEFYGPIGMTLDNDGNIYVSDTQNRRLQKFDNQGNHLLTFGVTGLDVGEIQAPLGSDIDSDGNLLVVDGFNKIVKYSPNGEFIMEWGGGIESPGDGDYEFNRPYDIAVDAIGNIYVADSGNWRIQIFDSTATYLHTIEIDGYEWGIYLSGVAVDDLGKLYVSGDDKIFIFDTLDDYKLLETWGGSGTELGQLGDPTRIFVENSSGEVYVAESGNNRVSIFNPDGTIKNIIGSAEPVDGYFYNPHDATIVGEEIFVADTDNSRVQVFNLDGTFLRKWGTYGNGNGEFLAPSGIDADSNGNIFVSDFNDHRIQEFSPDGTWINTTDISSHYPENCTDPVYGDVICTPQGLAIDHNDNVYVNIASTEMVGRVLVFDNEMNYQTQWDGDGYSIDFDSNGTLYMVGLAINIFTPEGELIRSFGQSSEPFSGMKGIAIDKNDDIYVMSGWYGFIKKYSNEGVLLGTFGQKGNGPGEFAWGSNLAITDDDVLYVMDAANQRIQIIAPSLPNPDSNSGLILNGNFGSVGVSGEDNKVDSFRNSVNAGIVLNGNRGSSPGLDHWVYGGRLGVSRSSTHTYTNPYSLKLGSEVIPATTQGISDSWAYQVLYVRPDWFMPVLTLNYNIMTNDSLRKSNFIVEIQDGVGLNNLDVVVLDGYEGATPGEIPSPGTDLGWKSITYDLSPYRGQYIRLVFGNRNLYPNSLGIWSYVDDIKIKDESLKFHFPLFLR